VAKTMSIWTRKVGYPIVTVVESHVERKINVRQDRLLQSNDLTEEENATIYPVSLDIITKGKGKDILLDKRETEIFLDDMDFFKLNAGHSGFFRTLYQPDRLRNLGEAMKTGLLSVEDRIGLIAEWVSQTVSFIILSRYHTTLAALLFS
jgi:aminopeptidase 2